MECNYCHYQRRKDSHPNHTQVYLYMYNRILNQSQKLQHQTFTNYFHQCFAMEGIVGLVACIKYLGKLRLWPLATIPIAIAQK